MRRNVSVLVYTIMICCAGVQVSVWATSERADLRTSMSAVIESIRMRSRFSDKATPIYEALHWTEDVADAGTPRGDASLLLRDAIYGIDESASPEEFLDLARMRYLLRQDVWASQGDTNHAYEVCRLLLEGASAFDDSSIRARCVISVRDILNEKSREVGLPGRCNDRDLAQAMLEFCHTESDEGILSQAVNCLRWDFDLGVVGSHADSVRQLALSSPNPVVLLLYGQLPDATVDELNELLREWGLNYGAMNSARSPSYRRVDIDRVGDAIRARLGDDDALARLVAEARGPKPVWSVDSRCSWSLLAYTMRREALACLVSVLESSGSAEVGPGLMPWQLYEIMDWLRTALLECGALENPISRSDFYRLRVEDVTRLARDYLSSSSRE